MQIQTKCIYDAAGPDDGHRVLVMTFWPRGVRKSEVDAWEKDLGTPPDLIKAWKSGKMTWAEFARCYRAAMKEQKAKIAGLAARARDEQVTLLCGCRDEDRCHRGLLMGLVMKATPRSPLTSAAPIAAACRPCRTSAARARETL